jgi:leucyl-tRNA synthetase
MDTFMDSSWYHFRYTSPKNDKEPFDPELARNWTPVDQYMGGGEHAVMHLLYARFFTKALRDIGFTDIDEPYKRLYSQGVMLARHKKISKRSNPLNPEPLIEKYGVDTVRLYLMFIGPWDQGGDWSDSGIRGIARWLNRLWDLIQRDPETLASIEADPEAEKALIHASHSTTKRAIQDLEQFKFNTAISGLMEFSNELSRLWDAGGASPDSWRDATDRMLRLLSPMAPHIAEELWERTGRDFSVHEQSLPEWDEALTTADLVTIVVQINGKVRAKLELPAGSSEDEVATAAMADRNIQAHIEGKQIGKQIYVPGRLLNLVVG